MATAFDTFNQYASTAFEGQINDHSMDDEITYVVESAAVPFGRALIQGATDRGAKLPAAAAAFIIGVSVRQVVSVGGGYLTGDGNANGNPVGSRAVGQESTALAYGRVWVKTLGGSTPGQQVYVVPNTGEFTNAATSGNLLWPGATFKTTAIANGMAVIQVRGQALATLVA
ncbi:hypothetical protein [Pseudomonas sp. GL-B-16]|uniref:structural cement protein Gp24 n=1 Tax=Pseudomonas sp. GL-B-16 TaxID=2832373 RepID=UPI001CBD0A94|nr:hypothetical protein [Pseudomonas sp. GL-B-16]